MLVFESVESFADSVEILNIDFLQLDGSEGITKSLPSTVVKSSHDSYNVSAICRLANRSSQGSKDDTISVLRIDKSRSISRT